MRHAPADGVGVAEQALRLAKLPGLERGAHRGTRYARALEQDIRHRFEQEAVDLRCSFQGSVVSGAPRTKTEVAPDEQPLHAQATHQDVLDEALRRKRGEARIEARNVNALHAHRLHELQLVAQPGEARRRGLAGEEFARVGFEAQDAGNEIQLARLGRHAIDERAPARAAAQRSPNRR